MLYCCFPFYWSVHLCDTGFIIPLVMCMHSYSYGVYYLFITTAIYITINQYCCLWSYSYCYIHTVVIWFTLVGLTCVTIQYHSATVSVSYVLLLVEQLYFVMSYSTFQCLVKTMFLLTHAVVAVSRLPSFFPSLTDKNRCSLIFCQPMMVS